MAYIVMRDNDTNELKHFGVKGMKWGVRRYQNKDGSLTNAGIRKYAKKGYAQDSYNSNKSRLGKVYDRVTDAHKYAGDIKYNLSSKKANKARAEKYVADQRAKKQAKKPMSTKKKIAIGAAVATGTALAAYGGYKLNKYMKNKRKITAPLLSTTELATDRLGNKFKRAAFNTSKRAKDAAGRAGRAVKNAPYNAKFNARKAKDAVRYKYGDAANRFAENARYAKDTAKFYAKNAAGNAAESARYASDNVRRAARKAGANVKDAANYRRMKRNGHILQPNSLATDRVGNKLKRAVRNAADDARYAAGNAKYVAKDAARRAKDTGKYASKHVREAADTAKYAALNASKRAKIANDAGRYAAGNAKYVAKDAARRVKDTGRYASKHVREAADTARYAALNASQRIRRKRR